MKINDIVESIGGQKLWIEHVAKELKQQLDSNLDINVGYTIQKLSRTREDEAEPLLRPLAPEFAAWFKRLAVERNSPAFAIDEMLRVYQHVGTIWPEIRTAIDESKDQILIMILKLIRNQNEDVAARYVKNLKQMGTTWPELKTISGSLLESKRDVSDGRQMIIDIMARKANSDPRGIIYVMYYLDSWNLNLQEWPEIRAIVDQKKDYIIRDILLAYKSDTKNAVEYAEFMVNRMRKIGLDWPEIAAIEKSIRGTSIKEARGDEPDQIVMRNFKLGILPGLRYMSMYDKTIDDIPEAADVIESRKEFVIRNMLRSLKNEDPESIEEVLGLLRSVGINWPELDTIEKSYRYEYYSSNEISEDDDSNEYGDAWRAKLEFQEHVASLRDNIKDQVWDMASFDLIDIGLLDVEYPVPPRTLELITSNKTGIIFGILSRIKESNHPEMLKYAVLALNNMGINWPELDIIHRSVTAMSQRNLDNHEPY